jgi:cytochrome b
MRKTACAAVRVWDLPVRLFHWSLVALFAFSWWSGKTGGNAMEWHVYSGYAILALVMFRLIWGFIGSTTARFNHFLRGPRRTIAYAAKLLRRAPGQALGHNPLGGLMAVVMLAGLLFQAVSGLFANDDIFTEGPLAHLVTKELSDRLTAIHGLVFNAVLALAAVHVTAVLFYLLFRKDNLVRPMLTGRRLLSEGTGDQVLRFVSPWRALVVLGVCACGVYVLVKWA